MRSAMRRLLDACVLLLLKLLFADVVCGYVGEWITYFIARRKLLSNRGRAEDGLTGLKVIICGFSRSGTRSLADAMRKLGFPCLHGSDLLSPGLCTLFMRAESSGKASDWERVLQGYAAIADYPATCAYKRLMELYPDAKVILNVRDAERWYRSFARTILVRLRSRDTISMIRRRTCMHRCVRKIFTQRLMAGMQDVDGASKEQCKEAAIAAYRRHTQEVEAHVPPDKLLVLDVDDNPGWNPLCEFLGVPVPASNIPFPQTNNSQSFQKIQSFIASVYARVLAVYVVVLSLLVAFVLNHYHVKLIPSWL